MSADAPEISVFIQNDSGMDIPPRSVVVVTYNEVTAASDTSESMVIAHVNQYTGQGGNILVTGLVTIPAASNVNPNYVQTSWWTPNNSYGVGYSDQRICVAMDTSSSLPLAGEQWGPISGKWFIGRGGKGFYADGYYAARKSTSTSNSQNGASGVDGNGGLDNVNPYYGIFLRGTPLKEHWAQIRSPLNPGTFTSPTTCTVDVWVANTTDTPVNGAVGLAPSTNNSLLGLRVVNRYCFTVPGPGSSSLSGNSINIPCRIKYDDDAGEWFIESIGRCQQVASNIACTSSGLSVTYVSMTG